MALVEDKDREVANEDDGISEGLDAQKVVGDDDSPGHQHEHIGEWPWPDREHEAGYQQQLEEWKASGGHQVHHADHYAVSQCHLHNIRYHPQREPLLALLWLYLRLLFIVTVVASFIICAGSRKNVANHFVDIRDIVVFAVAWVVGFVSIAILIIESWVISHIASAAVAPLFVLSSLGAAIKFVRLLA